MKRIHGPIVNVCDTCKQEIVDTGFALQCGCAGKRWAKIPEPLYVVECDEDGYLYENSSREVLTPEGGAE